MSTLMYVASAMIRSRTTRMTKALIARKMGTEAIRIMAKVATIAPMMGTVVIQAIAKAALIPRMMGTVVTQVAKMKMKMTITRMMGTVMIVAPEAVMRQLR